MAGFKRANPLGGEVCAERAEPAHYDCLGARVLVGRMPSVRIRRI